MDNSSESFDLVVIGGGPAGTSAAISAAIFGKHVALIEREPNIGGAGLNTGTLPSKALRESALLISGWRTRKLLGIELSLKKETTVAEFTHHEIDVRHAMQMVIGGRMKQLNVQVFYGTASFVAPRVVRIIEKSGNESRITGDKIVIATGSTPFHPPEFPFEHPGVHDSNAILEIVEMPKKLAVIGAGVIGAEYACTFAALGVEVHLVDGRDSLFPFLDHDVSEAITTGMISAGIHFHWKERVISCDPSASGEIVITLSSKEKLVVTDVLVAAGRNSNTSQLNLEMAGITPGKRGLITVNEVFQTSVPHIYATGDVIGAPALAATSLEQSRVAVAHAFNLLRKETTALLPTGIYTIPEASMIGQTENAARESGIDYVVGRADYKTNPRGHLIGDENGFLKLIFERKNLKLIGVHAVGEGATDLVHIGMMAMLVDADYEIFNRACFNYPTLGDLYKYAAYDAMLKKWSDGKIGAFGEE
jgi:NAD(P) transhydrogenase